MSLFPPRFIFKAICAQLTYIVVIPLAHQNLSDQRNGQYTVLVARCEMDRKIMPKETIRRNDPFAMAFLNPETILPSPQATSAIAPNGFAH
jgi:hypothetical protein